MLNRCSLPLLYIQIIQNNHVDPITHVEKIFLDADGTWTKPARWHHLGAPNFTAPALMSDACSRMKS